MDLKTETSKYMRSEKVREDIEAIENETIRKVCELLNEYDGRIKQYLVNLVGSLCDIPVDEMMSNTKDIDVVHARWFYWSAYRYMTYESFEKMSYDSNVWHYFAPSTIVSGVAKMGVMVQQDSLWAKRWQIIKGMIKILRDTKGGSQKELFPQTIKVTVTHPREVEINLKQE